MATFHNVFCKAEFCSGPTPSYCRVTCGSSTET
jgi:hypothetical protein